MKTTGGFHFTSVLGVLTFLTTRDLFFFSSKNNAQFLATRKKKYGFHFESRVEKNHYGYTYIRVFAYTTVLLPVVASYEK